MDEAVQSAATKPVFIWSLPPVLDSLGIKTRLTTSTQKHPTQDKDKQGNSSNPLENKTH